MSPKDIENISFAETYEENKLKVPFNEKRRSRNFVQSKHQFKTIFLMTILRPVRNILLLAYIESNLF